MFYSIIPSALIVGFISRIVSFNLNQVLFFHHIPKTCSWRLQITCENLFFKIKRCVGPIKVMQVPYVRTTHVTYSQHIVHGYSIYMDHTLITTWQHITIWYLPKPFHETEFYPTSVTLLGRQHLLITTCCISYLVNIDKLQALWDVG